MGHGSRSKGQIKPIELVPLVICGVAVILYSLCLAGTNSVSDPNLSAVRISSAKNKDVSVLVNYFTLCAEMPGQTRGRECVQVLTKNEPDQVIPEFLQMTDELKHLVIHGQWIRTHVLMYLMLVSAGFFFFQMLLQLINFMIKLTTGKDVNRNRNKWDKFSRSLILIFAYGALVTNLLAASQVQWGIQDVSVHNVIAMDIAPSIPFRALHWMAAATNLIHHIACSTFQGLHDPLKWLADRCLKGRGRSSGGSSSRGRSMSRGGYDSPRRSGSYSPQGGGSPAW